MSGALQLRQVSSDAYLEPLNTHNETHIIIRATPFSDTLHFIFLLNGELEIVVNYDSKSVLESLSKGTFIALQNPDSVIVKNAKNNPKFLILNIDAAYLNKIFPPKNLIGEVLSINRCEDLPEKLKNRVAAFFSNQKRGMSRELYKHAKAMELISDLIDQRSDCKNAPAHEAMTLSSKDVNKIQNARDILTKDLSSPPSLLELSSMVNMNLNKLKKGFRYLYGIPPYKVLHKCRMETASRMLSQRDMNVSEVAWAVGYFSLGHFSSAFFKYFGVKPKTFQLEMTRFTRSEYGHNTMPANW